MTPEHFLSFYSMIYDSDKDIANLKEFAIILSISFMIIGIFDNIICIYAFVQEKLLEKKFNWYLLIASVFKLIFCATLLLDYMFAKIYHARQFLHDLNKYSSFLVDFTIHTSDSCISLLTVILSFDRLYAIKNPLKITEFITYLHAKCLICVSLISFVIFIIFNILLCEQHIDKNVHIIFCTIVSPTILNTIPLLLTLVLNILLVKEAIKNYCKRNSNDIKKKTSSKALIELDDLKNRRRSTIRESFNYILEKNTEKSHYFLIVTNIWSVLTATPYYILNSYYILFNINYFSVETIVILQIISSVLFNSNYCVDFFIYISFYAEFRNILIEIFERFKIRRKSVTVNFI